MEKCYEYLGCREHDCVIFSMPDKVDCWNVEGTLCNNEGINLLVNSLGKNKESACHSCLYYNFMISGKN